MQISLPARVASAALLTLAALTAASPAVRAADTSIVPTAAEPAEDRDMAAARQAIKDRQWTLAANHLQRVVAREPRNADAHNLLGFSYRWMERMNESFAHYAKALEIDPRHRGAHEYVGVAYLKVGNKAKAEWHLAQLRDICGANCEETRSLAAKVSEFRTAAR